MLLILKLLFTYDNEANVKYTADEETKKFLIPYSYRTQSLYLFYRLCQLHECYNITFEERQLFLILYYLSDTTENESK